MKRGIYIERLVIALVMSTALQSSQLLAQDDMQGRKTPADSDQPSRHTGTQIEDIIVTAQRRDERIQSVPIAITAISSVQAEKQGIKTVDDIQIATPALTITRVLQAPLFYLRGVGTANQQPQEEPSIPLYVDGFYASTGAGSILSLTNIDRIEVLRGPQGTLFGRNGTGGLINVITRTPSHEFGGTFEIGYGNYNTLEAKLYATAGLNEKVAADLAVYYVKRSDGFGRNLVLNTDVGHNREFALRSKWLIEPTDRTKLTLAGEYSNVRTDYGFTSQLAPGVVGVDGTVRQGPYDISANLVQYTTPKTYAVSARIDQDVGFANFVSMTQFRKNRTYWQKDVESLPINFSNAFQREYTKYFTQEIQLQAPSESPLQWVIGGFYLNGDGGIDPLLLSGSVFPAVLASQTRTANVASESYAGFAQGTYEIFDRVKLTLGGRYTHDRKVITGEILNQLASGGVVTSLTGIHQVLKSGKFTYRAALDYQMTDDVLLYGVVSRGYKAGTFNVQTPGDPAVKPETLDALEAGLKTDLLDRKLRVNLSAYHYKYKEIQLTQLVPVSGGAASLSRILNATSAKIYGFELEVVARPVSQFTISSNIAYTHGRYDSFQNAPFTAPAPFACSGNPASPVTTTPSRPVNSRNAQCTGDASGNKVVRTPAFTSTVSVNYDIPLGENTLSLSSSWYHNSGFYFEPDNRVKQNAYDLVNADVRLTLGERYAIRGWVRNLFNKWHIAGISLSNQDIYVPAAPRTYGGSLIVNF